MSLTFWKVLGRVCLQSDFRRDLFGHASHALDTNGRLPMGDIPDLYDYLVFPSTTQTTKPVLSYCINRHELLEINRILVTHETDHASVPPTRKRPALGEDTSHFQKLTAIWGTKQLGSQDLHAVIGLLCVDHLFRTALIKNGGRFPGLIIEFPPVNGTTKPPTPFASGSLGSTLTNAEADDLADFLLDPDTEPLLQRITEDAWDEVAPVANRCEQGMVFADYTHPRAPDRGP